MSETEQQPTETEQRTAELVASNSARLNTLSHRDIGLDMQQLTFRHLIEVLFPTKEARDEMNLSFQEHLARVLTEIEEQADAIVLQNTQSSGLVLPGPR